MKYGKMPLLVINVECLNYFNDNPMRQIMIEESNVKTKISPSIDEPI